MRPASVLLCLLWVSLTLAASVKKPYPCKSPPLLTGAFMFSTQNEKASAYAPYEYDALQQRIRIYEVGTFQNQSYTYDVLLLYTEGVIYEIDDKASKCVKSPLQGDFQPLGVPPNSSLLGSAVLGSSSGPGQGLLVNTWTGEDPGGEKYMVTVTEFGCVPVSTVYHTQDFGWVSVTYMNNVEGIVDPSALIPPSFCPSRDVKPDGKPQSLFSVIEKIRNKAA